MLRHSDGTQQLAHLQRSQNVAERLGNRGQQVRRGLGVGPVVFHTVQGVEKLLVEIGERGTIDLRTGNDGLARREGGGSETETRPRVGTLTYTLLSSGGAAAAKAAFVSFAPAMVRADHCTVTVGTRTNRLRGSETSCKSSCIPPAGCVCTTAKATRTRPPVAAR